MDFAKYYQSQAREEGLPVFKARPFMRGYGFGNVFKKFFRWISPIVKENALPVLKNIGKLGLRSAANIANETLDGKDFSESLKTNLKDSINKIKDQFGNGKKRKSLSIQDGMGKKNVLTTSAVSKKLKMMNALRHKNKKSRKKRVLDIFDKK